MEYFTAVILVSTTLLRAQEAAPFAPYQYIFNMLQLFGLSRLHHIMHKDAPFEGRSTHNASHLSVCLPLAHLPGLLWRRELHERQALAPVGVVHDLDVYGRRAHPLLKDLHEIALWEALHALQRHSAALETQKKNEELLIAGVFVISYSTVNCTQ